jgi:WD40 repeat protein
MKWNCISALLGVAAVLTLGCGTANQTKQSQPDDLQDTPAPSQMTGSTKSVEGATLKSQGGMVVGLAFSPDGSMLAAGSSDGKVSLWNRTGQVSSLGGHSANVYTVVFSPDGKLLASGGKDKTVKLWDMAAKQQVAAFPDLPDIVTALAFDPESKRLAVGITDNFDNSKTMVRIFDLASKKATGTLSGSNSRVNSVAFSFDGQTLAAGSANLCVWDLKDASTKKSHNLLAICKLAAFWPDGRLLMFTTPSSWNINTPQTAGVITFKAPEKDTSLATLAGHSNMVQSLALAADRTLLASSAREVKLWDLKEKKELFSRAPFPEFAISVALSPDGKFLAAGGDDGTIKLWDLTDGIPK